MAEGELAVLAEKVIDDDLTLLLARSDNLPRVGIFNTNSNKRKFVYLSWSEGAERSLKIKIGRNIKEYPMSAIINSISSLISTAEEKMELKPLEWRAVQMIGDILHAPKTARSVAELNLVDEEKRSTLWYIYTPSKGDWVVKPAFIMTGAERAVLDNHLKEGAPWPGFALDEAVMTPTMRNNNTAKEIMNANANRWGEFLLPISKAMLLGFSDWSPLGEHTFGGALWKHITKDDFRSDERRRELASEGRLFTEKLISYLRLHPIIGNIQANLVPDSAKLAEERGLKKRERFEMFVPRLNDKKFMVLRFSDEESGDVSFGVTPDTRLPGENDKFMTISASDWETSVDACSLGGEKDPQYTCKSIMDAVEVHAWYSRICECLTNAG
ncbi:hypothetical protein FACS1894167_06650 [Synergistales bacterium]|nr:hypothetical protein FACS1894167_06650 [Synergistales bacterium]